MDAANTLALSSLKQVAANPVSVTPHDVVVNGGYAYLATGGGVWVIQLVNQ